MREGKSTSVYPADHVDTSQSRNWHQLLGGIMRYSYEAGSSPQLSGLYIASVRTSRETHYVSATEPKWLMLFGETVAVYCENHTEHTDTVCTSQETYYVSATEPNRLMLFRETVAVYCENHTEHTDTVRTSRETHYVSATEPNRLMLFGETVAVYCENHTEHTDTVCTSQETH
jgi:predicted Zn-dependent protease with MMP-like domain